MRCLGTGLREDTYSHSSRSVAGAVGAATGVGVVVAIVARAADADLGLLDG